MCTSNIPPAGSPRALLTIVLLTLTFPLARGQSEQDVPRWSVQRLVQYHLEHHPRLSVEDVYKLLYEASFGVRHILTDSSAALVDLEHEMASLDSIPAGETLLEPISIHDDMVRVNLRPFKLLNLSPPLLVKVMFQSARETLPDTLLFNRLWNEFSALVKYGLLRLPETEVEAWDAKVEKGQTPPVHHSPEYTSANHPAYRVVRRSIFEGTFGKITR